MYRWISNYNECMFKYKIYEWLLRKVKDAMKNNWSDCGEGYKDTRIEDIEGSEVLST
jgi:hypothetical protein